MNTKKQLAKVMPSKSKVYNDSIVWSKRGGHAGDRMIAKAVEKLKGLGFKEASFNTGARPDGAYISNTTALVDDFGNQVKYGSSYGVTAYENYYHMTMTFSKDSLDIENRSV